MFFSWQSFLIDFCAVPYAWPGGLPCRYSARLLSWLVHWIFLPLQAKLISIFVCIFTGAYIHSHRRTCTHACSGSVELLEEYVVLHTRLCVCVCVCVCVCERTEFWTNVCILHQLWLWSCHMYAYLRACILHYRTPWRAVNFMRLAP